MSFLGFEDDVYYEAIDDDQYEFIEDYFDSEYYEECGCCCCTGDCYYDYEEEDYG